MGKHETISGIQVLRMGHIASQRRAVWAVPLTEFAPSLTGGGGGLAKKKKWKCLLAWQMIVCEKEKVQMIVCEKEKVPNVSVLYCIVHTLHTVEQRI